MHTEDRLLTELLKSISTGKTQLPDFQRGWVWDDGRIKALIGSIVKEYPVGAAMYLGYGNAELQLKYRSVEGATAGGAIPEELILDGQQRLTSLYTALWSDEAVRTRLEKDKDTEILRYYYIDIAKSLDPQVDRADAILSVSDKRVSKSLNLDLSSPEKEFEQKMFPLNKILDPTKWAAWQQSYFQYHQWNSGILNEFIAFQNQVIIKLQQYKLPVIILDKDTPKEAVCQVFENVNTGGVSLTVFELVTAIYAMNDFDLRKDWRDRREKYFGGDILSVVAERDFLTACTLYSLYVRRKTVSCKKKDILELRYSDYIECADMVSIGFAEAEMLLQEERIFIADDLPYSTQLIPLAVLCALLRRDNQLGISSTREKLKQWYWCGVFGELYGGANETRFVNDVVGVMKWIKGEAGETKTVQESFFNPTRLLTLQSRQSAAYKGIMALILKNHCCDLISGQEMDFVSYKSEKIDIHHIFPRVYCIQKRFDKAIWNSVVNKAPLSYKTNRMLQGDAPSVYLKRIENKGQVQREKLDEYLESHWIDAVCIRGDLFEKFIVGRAIKILNAIENATGKRISGRDSDEVLARFGESLVG